MFVFYIIHSNWEGHIALWWSFVVIPQWPGYYVWSWWIFNFFLVAHS